MRTSADEKKIRELLKFIEKEKKYTGAADHQYGQGARLALDGVQINAEIVLSKLGELQTRKGAEKTDASSDWIYKLLRYLVRVHGVAEAAQKNAVQERKLDIHSRTFHTYSNALIEEARKLFPEFAQVLVFKGDLSNFETYSDFQKRKQKLSRFNGRKLRYFRAVTTKHLKTPVQSLSAFQR